MPWWLDFIILLFMTSRKRITIIGAATTSTTTTLCSSRLLPGKWLSQMSMQRVSLTYHYFQKTLKFVRYSQILDYFEHDCTVSINNFHPIMADVPIIIQPNVFCLLYILDYELKYSSEQILSLPYKCSTLLSLFLCLKNERCKKNC